MAYGQDARVGLSFQNSYGTASVASLHWLEPVSESVTLKKAQNVAKGLRGIYDEGAHIEGANTVEGDITVEGKANALGVLLAATNASSVSITSGALYTHTFKPRTSDAQAKCPERPFTYLKYLGDGGSAHQFANMNGASLELSIANGELMTAKIGMVGGTFSRVAAVAATYSSSNPIDWSVSSVSVGGSAISNVRQLTVSQNNNLETKFVLDVDKTPARIARSNLRQIEISGTLIFDDQTQMTQFLNQSEQRAAVFLQGSSLVQSGYYESLLVDIPSLRFTEHPVAVGGPNQLEVSFKGAAVYNVGSACSIAYTLACGKAGF